MTPSGQRPPIALLAALAAALAALAAAAAGEAQTAGAPTAADDPVFAERAVEAGLDFLHFNGMSGELYYLENMVGGAALVDYDGDGDLDVYLVQGGMLGPGKSLADATFPPPPGMSLGDRLFRNDLAPGADGRPRMRFVDVSERAGLTDSGYGAGVAAADVDDDGDVDLYVTHFGSNRLWRNRGDGTFEDRTAASGTDDVRWSVPATFFDLDGDGDLDLYLGNYVDFTFALERRCADSTGARDYCGPLAYEPQGDRLFRNRGDGTFEDWTARSGVDRELGGALGAIAADFNGDGLPDVYVANDMTPNLLWINRGDGTFVNEGLFAGAAVNWEGKPEASMGVDAADYDGDGDEDLFMAHLTGETNTLYTNDGQGVFSDRTPTTGLGGPSWNFTSFGTAWVDFDNDGRLDLLTVNGAVKTIAALAAAGDPYPLHQPNQLFRNLGEGRFEEVTAAAGPAFELSEVSRGAAFGDLDNDGDHDVVVVNNAGPVRLLENLRGAARPWIGFRLLGGAGPGDQLGARVEIVRAGADPLWRRARTDGSYASANDPRVLAGLGEPAPERVRVHWPWGGTSEFPALQPGRYHVLYR